LFKLAQLFLLYPFLEYVLKRIHKLTDTWIVALHFFVLQITFQDNVNNHNHRVEWNTDVASNNCIIDYRFNLSSPPIFSGVRVTRSLVLCVCFIDRCLSFCPFPYGHCVVCFTSIYGFWLPLWYLQILLSLSKCSNFAKFFLFQQFIT
jgi:hypothetical protein